MKDGFRPGSAVFYSTNRGWGWGAPDYVWPLAAERLLSSGLPVLVVAHPQVLAHPVVEALKHKGLRTMIQPTVSRVAGRLASVRQWMNAKHKSPVVNALAGIPRPHMFINQGGDFDIHMESALTFLLGNGSISYDLIVHSTNYAPTLTEVDRQQIGRWFESARAVFFNSTWCRAVVETKLLRRIINAREFGQKLRFAPPGTPLPWPLGGTARLAAVCRMDVHHKGLDILLHACAQLKNHPQAWKLSLVGHGREIAYLREMTHWLNLTEHVTFQDYTEEVRNIWRDHHMLVLTSRYEGFGVSMLEALACGRPVLRTPYGGAEEWIKHGVNGWICPAPEIEQITRTLAAALDQFPHWESMGEASHRKVLIHYNPHPENMFLEPFGLQITSLKT